MTDADKLMKILRDSLQRVRPEGSWVELSDWDDSSDKDAAKDEEKEVAQLKQEKNND